MTEATNPAVSPHALGTLTIEPMGKVNSTPTENIYYVLTSVKILKPLSGNINFELMQIDYSNNKLIYSFEYTDGQPAEGGAMGNYLLPIFMPHLDPEGNGSSYFIPETVELQNAADSSKKKSGTVSTNNPTHLDETNPSPDVPRVAVASVTSSSEGNSLTTYFIIILTKTTSANSRNLSIAINGADINCSYSLEENVPEVANPRASIGAVMSQTNGEYKKVKLSGNTVDVPIEDGKYTNLLKFSFPS